MNSQKRNEGYLSLSYLRKPKHLNKENKEDKTEL